MRRPRWFLVTDLDNTLVDSRARFNRSIAEAMGHSHTHVPQTVNVRGLGKEQRNKFYELFLSGRYMHLDVPVKGSVEVLARLRSMDVGIIYLTGRHHSRGDSLKDETLKMLSHYNYPMPDKTNVMLFLKPKRMFPTQEYKRRVLERITKSMNLVVGVDDEPDDLSVMAKLVSLTIGLALSSQVASEVLAKVKVPIARDWFEVESIMKQNAIV
jgi:hypothetical protein